MAEFSPERRFTRIDRLPPYVFNITAELKMAARRRRISLKSYVPLPSAPIRTVIPPLAASRDCAGLFLAGIRIAMT